VAGLMTATDIEILVRYLRKAIVPAAEQEQFLKAFLELIALQQKAVSPIR